MQNNSSFTDSNEFVSSILIAGRSADLHIDQISELQGLVAKVITGQVKRDDFPLLLINEVGVDRSTAVNIIEILNALVFEKIRQSLTDEDQPEATEVDTADTVDESHRDSILDEIENPTPVIPTVHTNKNIEVPKDILPKKEVSYPTNWMFPESKQSKPVEQSQSAPAAAKPNSFEQILKKPTQTSAPRNPIPAKNYGNDPYRESFE